MTSDELQGLIDEVDEAAGYFEAEVRRRLRVVSNLLVDLPDEVVERLTWREDELVAPPRATPRRRHHDG